MSILYTTWVHVLTIIIRGPGPFDFHVGGGPGPPPPFLLIIRRLLLNCPLYINCTTIYYTSLRVGYRKESCVIIITVIHGRVSK